MARRAEVHPAIDPLDVERSGLRLEVAQLREAVPVFFLELVGRHVGTQGKMADRAAFVE
jgi:hypothetical protein